MKLQATLVRLFGMVTLLMPIQALAQDRSVLSPRTLALWGLLIVVAFLVSRRRAMRAHERLRNEALKQDESKVEKSEPQ